MERNPQFTLDAGSDWEDGGANIELVRNVGAVGIYIEAGAVVDGTRGAVATPDQAEAIAGELLALSVAARGEPDPRDRPRALDVDTRTKGTRPPFEYWEGDHTALVHVLWHAKRQGLTLDSADDLASMILQSRWAAAYRANG